MASEWTQVDELKAQAKQALEDEIDCRVTAYPTYPASDFEIVEDFGPFKWSVIARKKDEYQWTLHPGETDALLDSAGEELHFLGLVPVCPSVDKYPRDWRNLPMRLVIVRKRSNG